MKTSGTSSQPTEPSSTRQTHGSETLTPPERRRLIMAGLIWAVTWAIVIVLAAACILILR